MPTELLGPTGLLVALVLAVGVLWRDHVRADTDDRRERDEWRALAASAEADIRKLTDVLERIVGERLSRP